jgi:hypothetical protein
MTDNGQQRPPARDNRDLPYVRSGFPVVPPKIEARWPATTLSRSTAMVLPITQWP